jgi:hypothetical protein
MQKLFPNVAGLAVFATEFRQNPPVAPMSFTFALVAFFAQALMLGIRFLFSPNLSSQDARAMKSLVRAAARIMITFDIINY